MPCVLERVRACVRACVVWPSPRVSSCTHGDRVNARVPLATTATPSPRIPTYTAHLGARALAPRHCRCIAGVDDRVFRHPSPPTIRGDYPPTRFFVGAQLPTETDQYIVRRVVPRNSGPSRPARFRRKSELFRGRGVVGGRVAKRYGEKKKAPGKIVEEKIIIITRRIIL